MKDFLWDEADGDIHYNLIAWDQVCRPKERGGLGIGNICRRNMAHLGKWWWRFSCERTIMEED